MTFRTVVRNTRGLKPGDTVSRLNPDGYADNRYFRLRGVITGSMVYRDEIHHVYLLDGITTAVGKSMHDVKMIVTGNAPWCVSR